jgi:hypothetical protein
MIGLTMCAGQELGLAAYCLSLQSTESRVFAWLCALAAQACYFSLCEIWRCTKIIIEQCSIVHIRLISVSYFMAETLIEMAMIPISSLATPIAHPNTSFDVQPDYDSQIILSLRRFADIKALSHVDGISAGVISGTRRPMVHDW